MTDRTFLHQKFGIRYKNISVYDKQFLNKCFYCGETFECYDHAPPLSMIRDMDGLYHGEYLLIPACNSCNCLLGASSTWNLQERAELLKKKIYKKHNKDIIRGLKWSVEDLKDFNIKSSLFPEVLKTKYTSLIISERLLFRNPIFYVGSNKNKPFLLEDTTVNYSYLRDTHTEEELEALERLFRKYLF